MPLRLTILILVLAICGALTALWTGNRVHEAGFGFPESFVADEALTNAWRPAIAGSPDAVEARTQPRR